ncbi:MAG: GNAT family N-acetyltransferase [Deltaproteobacteria bacterium]|nr:GNAT family N-acetyltransferase [Deltaproteobacteria bacterium]
MSNFFSSNEFFTAYARSKFPKESFSIEPVSVGGSSFKLLKVKGSFVTSLPFQDFLEPCSETLPVREKIAYLPRVSLTRMSADDWLLQQDVEKEKGHSPSPLTDWTKFQSWDDYLSWTQGRNKNAFSKNTQYKFRRLERALGKISFDFNSIDRDILELCFDWKSDQYRASGLVDGLSKGAFNRIFFKQMFDDGLLTIAVMKAGDTILAIHIGVVWHNRFYYWVPAFDPAHRKHSAGSILLEKMIEWSYREGHSEFDWLEGGEPYKFTYATDVRIMETIGTPPPIERIWKPVRKKLIVHIRKYTTLYETARSLKRFVLNQRMK